MSECVLETLVCVGVSVCVSALLRREDVCFVSANYRLARKRSTLTALRQKRG